LEKRSLGMGKKIKTSTNAKIRRGDRENHFQKKGPLNKKKGRDPPTKGCKESGQPTQSGSRKKEERKRTPGKSDLNEGGRRK